MPVIFLAMADRQNAMARCPFRRVSTVSDGVVRETTRRSGSKPGPYSSPVNREYPNRNAARRDRFPHSAEQELLDRQQPQLCVSATSSLALSIRAPLISSACCQSCDASRGIPIGVFAINRAAVCRACCQIVGLFRE